MIWDERVTEMVVSITRVDPDTPLSMGFNPSAGTFPVLPTLLPAGVWILPSVGEQWLVRRIGDSWYLDSRVAFQDPKMNFREEEGTTAYGSSGPTYIIGSRVHVGPDHIDLLEKITELEQRIADLEGGQ